MEEIPFNTFHQHPGTLGPDSSVSRAFDWEKVEPLSQDSKDSAMNDEGDESLVDSMLCDSRSILIPSGFTKSNSTG
jgi:kinesin family protein C2/C3